MSAPEDPLVAKAFSGSGMTEEDFIAALKNVPPEKAELLLKKLEYAIRKRKIQIVGYLVAMLVWLVAMVFALVWYGTHDGFVGWAFVLPFGLVGAILFAFGKYADKVGSVPPK